MNGWTFAYLMVVLKIPIAALLYLVWWAVHQTPDDETEREDGGGGSKLRPHHPRDPLPRTPRRGPHGDPPLPAPARTRGVVARSRETPHV